MTTWRHWLLLLFAVPSSAANAGTCPAHGVDDSGQECMPTKLQFCCNERASLQVVDLGLGDVPWNELYVLDDLMCPPYLQVLREASFGISHTMVPPTFSSFPGVRTDYHQAFESALKLNNMTWVKVFKALARGDHKKCVQQVFQRANRSDVAKNFDLIQEYDYGINGRDVGYISAVTTVPKTNTVHSDRDERGGTFVLNFHYSREFNETGSSFWKIRGGQTVIGSNEEEPKQYKKGRKLAKEITVCGKESSADCADAIEKVMHHFERKNLSAGFAAEEDVSGVMEKYNHHLIRTNRALMFYGNLPHTAYVPEHVAHLITDSKTDKRWITQDFISVPSRPELACQH